MRGDAEFVTQFPSLATRRGPRERRHGGMLVLRSGCTVRLSRAFADRVSLMSASGSTRQKSRVSCNTIDSASFIG